MNSGQFDEERIYDEEMREALGELVASLDDRDEHTSLTLLRHFGYSQHATRLFRGCLRELTTALFEDAPIRSPSAWAFGYLRNKREEYEAWDAFLDALTEEESRALSAAADEKMEWGPFDGVIEDAFTLDEARALVEEMRKQ